MDLNLVGLLTGLRQEHSQRLNKCVSKPSVYQLLRIIIGSFGEQWSDTNGMDLGLA